MDNTPGWINSKSRENHQHMFFVEMHNKCPLCGSQLEFKVEELFVDESIKETAHCSNCSIKTREKVHTIH